MEQVKCYRDDLKMTVKIRTDPIDKEEFVIRFAIDQLEKSIGHIIYKLDYKPEYEIEIKEKKWKTKQSLSNLQLM